MGKNGKKEKVWCHLRDLILLDSGSTCHTFMNPDLVKWIRKSDNPINMSTNVGSKKIDVEGSVPPLNVVQFVTGGLANVTALRKIIPQGTSATMDSHKEHCFNAYFFEGEPPIKFHLTEDGNEFD